MSMARALPERYTGDFVHDEQIVFWLVPNFFMVYCGA